MLEASVTYLTDDKEERTVRLWNDKTDPQTLINSAKICWPTWVVIETRLTKGER